MGDFDFSARNEETVIEASLPLGKYIAIVTEVTSNDKGTLVFKYVIQEDDKGDTKYANRKLTDYKSFSPAARKYSLEAIKRMSQSAFGNEIGNKLDFTCVEDYHNTFSGKTVKFSIKHEEFNGEMQPKVSSYIPRKEDDPFVAANIASREEVAGDYQQEKAVPLMKQPAPDDCPF